MRAVVFHGPKDLRVDDVPDAAVVDQTDAVVRMTHAAICGSDLWFYRGVNPYQIGRRTGHEFLGVVEEAGSAVPQLRPGTRVLASMVIADGTCEFCSEGLATNCRHGGFFAWPGYDGAQADYVRVPHAAGTLTPLPSGLSDDDPLLTRLLPLTDVMSTGYHAAFLAGVTAGHDAIVIGDGAVGLCAVLGAARRGAERLVVLGAHADRLAMAQRFGATHVIQSRGDEAAQEVLELLPGGAHCVMECVGTQDAFVTAIALVRPGGSVGIVGAPHTDGTWDINRVFRHNITVRAGVAPVQRYLPELVDAVVSGDLDPSPLFTSAVDLGGIAAGYEAMDTRQQIKVLVRP
jgi:threonine dehydrogenase-like Zn-dependent dehydrogenase